MVRDTVNLFAVPTGPVTVEASAGGALDGHRQRRINTDHSRLHRHCYLALAVTMLAFSSKLKPRNVQVSSILG